MNKKTSAVDWLENELNELSSMGLSIGQYISVRKNIFEQAKAMEKEQIIDAASDHCYPTCESARFYADEYYNETFKSE